MNRRILRLAIPNIISNLSVPLLSSVDTALLGHLDEIYYLGALSVGGIIFNFVYWGFGFLRMGTTGLTAQAYGQRDREGTLVILAQTVSVALLSALILIASQWIIAKVSFALIDATSAVELHARQYFHIRIYAAPATLTLYAFHGWFLGLQNVKVPLILTVVVNSLNIVLNLVFIYGFGMKSDGVAYATVIAQYCGLAGAFAFFLRLYSVAEVTATLHRVLDLAALKRIFRFNFDIFLRTLGLIFTFSFFTAKSAESGDAILAANSILLQLLMIMAYGVDGFAFAAESLVGRYVGAENLARLKQTIRYSLAWGIGLGILVSLVYWAAGEQVLALFTNKPEVIFLCLTYMAWVVIAPLINSYCFIWDGIFIGATEGAAMRNAMLFCTFLVFLPVYLLTRAALGNHGLWLALTLFMLMRGVTLTLYARRIFHL